MAMDIKQEYIQYPQGIGANGTNGTDSTAPAGETKKPEKLETAFDVDGSSTQTTESAGSGGVNLDTFVSTTGADTGTQSSGAQVNTNSSTASITAATDSADVEALVKEKAQVDEGVQTNRTAQEAAQQTASEARTESDQYNATVTTLTQENETIHAAVVTVQGEIKQLKDENSNLQTERTALEDEKSGLVSALGEVVSAIADVASNAFDAITGFFTGDSQKAALEAQKGNIETQIQQTEDKIQENEDQEEENNNVIDKDETEKTDLETQEKDNDGKISDADKAGKEADARADEADEEAEEAGEAVTAGEDQSQVLAEKIQQISDEESNSTVTTEEPTAEETTNPPITVTAPPENEAPTVQQEEQPVIIQQEKEPVIVQQEQPATIKQIKQPEQLTPQTIVQQEQIPTVTAPATEIPETQEPVVSYFKPEISSTEYFEYVDAMMTYQDLGVELDYNTFANASVTELDSIVETARTQEIMKSTGTGKVVGNISNFTSKKDMEDYSEATSEFMGNYNALSNYYSANDVDDFEVQSFLTLGSNIVTKINQGYVYDTSDLQQMSSDAMSLLSTLKTRVTSTNDDNKNADTQFTQEKTKTEGILNDAQTKLGEQAEENTHLADCRVEFLNLTTSFTNANNDSEQMSYIKLMQELGEKAQRVKDNPDSQNPYLDGSLWIAA